MNLDNLCLFVINLNSLSSCIEIFNNGKIKFNKKIGSGSQV